MSSLTHSYLIDHTDPPECTNFINTTFCQTRSNNYFHTTIYYNLFLILTFLLIFELSKLKLTLLKYISQNKFFTLKTRYDIVLKAPLNINEPTNLVVSSLGLLSQNAAYGTDFLEILLHTVWGDF